LEPSTLLIAKPDAAYFLVMEASRKEVTGIWETVEQSNSEARLIF